MQVGPGYKDGRYIGVKKEGQFSQPVPKRMRADEMVFYQLCGKTFFANGGVGVPLVYWNSGICEGWPRDRKMQVRTCLEQLTSALETTGSIQTGCACLVDNGQNEEGLFTTAWVAQVFKDLGFIPSNHPLL